MSECKAIRSDGTPCRAHALRGGDFCFFHDPGQRDALIQATRKGGARRGPFLTHHSLFTTRYSMISALSMAGFCPIPLLQSVYANALSTGFRRTLAR